MALQQARGSQKDRNLKKAHALAARIINAVEGLNDFDLTECGTVAIKIMDSVQSSIPKSAIIKEEELVNASRNVGLNELVERVRRIKETDACCVHRVTMQIEGVTNHSFNLFQCGASAVLGNSWACQFRYRTLDIRNLVQWVSELRDDVIESAEVASRTTLNAHSERLSILQEKILARFGRDDPSERACIPDGSKVPFNAAASRGRPSHRRIKYFMSVKSLTIDSRILNDPNIDLVADSPESSVPKVTREPGESMTAFAMRRARAGKSALQTYPRYALALKL